ncbi:hypothetical protein GCM10011390_24260 [Aureimonas endophytica]|uniref:EamA-like transporter family protein n=1 Tax=Aureimonas endophytica TaxID=2027858 RepID=A0A916ZN56_9HYPH|nr:transporter [Aureimonas endophytica]GGE04472.1 hypothetical protein GCM10011390_24260 [Aureimonas endophytica]
MSGATALALGLTILLDVAGQILFKLGLDRAPQTGLPARVLGSPVIALGILAYGVEFVAWLFVLSRADLSVAFPLATLSYGGVLIASRLLLGEAVPRRRLLATLLIAAGAALVGASA